MKRMIAMIIMMAFVLTQAGISYALRTEEPAKTAVAVAVGEDMATAPAAGKTILQLNDEVKAAARDWENGMQLLTTAFEEYMIFKSPKSLVDTRRHQLRNTFEIGQYVCGGIKASGNGLQ